ncbi:TetR/AcrR family transcriptional regulator [Abyssisolibacter fermentans]|uniref:TetR/AcrR family transcriptional regulator n=1 Tax=Abyssisolibacter fermentans TaxID=1766203 RepID=UPI00082C343C|nr:TetR/AcrR family transcriptional regulator [Abyssisolibacter fermentans]
MNRNKKDVAIRKQEILETALKLFITKGYEKTTTNDIMKAINISRGGLYHHFASKEEILDSAITSLLISEKSRVKSIIDDEKLSAVDKLKIIIGFDSSSQPMVGDIKTLVEEKENPTLITHLLKKKLEIITPLFVDIIEQGINEGLFICKYPEQFSKISVILSTLLFTDTLIHMSYEEYEKMIKAFQIIIEAMLGVETGAFNFISDYISKDKW